MKELIKATALANGIATSAEHIHNELLALKEAGEKYEEQAKALIVASEASSKEAGQIIVEIKSTINAVGDSTLGRCIEAAHKLHRMLTSARGMALEPLERAEKTLRQKIIEYVRAEQMRKAQEEAERVARERKALEEAAKKLEKKAPEIAQEIKQRAENIVAEPVKVESPIRIQKRWYAEIEDMTAFLKAAAKNETLRAYVDIDLTAMARDKSRNNALEIPGIRFAQREV